MEIETYYEKNLIIDGRALEYKGIFKAGQLFQVINQALKERGYTKREKRTDELVTPEGKRTFIELRPFKEVSNYGVLMIKIKILLDKVTEVVEEHQGHKQKFDRGDIEIVFDAWVLTDYESRWTLKPLVYFMKGMINKFIYRFPFEAGFPRTLTGDTAYIYGQIKRLLHSYARDERKIVKEEEIVKKVKEEIGKQG
ncbi:hypothetical protein HYX14_03525 [Candidatus Woesearchaeota archaeon]|nr:hypothetical protein [Candidatus Woesearchaeota archaeon]